MYTLFLNYVGLIWVLTCMLSDPKSTSSRVCIYCSLEIKVGSCIENYKNNLLKVLRPRCRNLECCCLKADCSRTQQGVVCTSALISGLNASWCLRATAHALEILSDQTVVFTPVVLDRELQNSGSIPSLLRLIICLS